MTVAYIIMRQSHFPHEPQASARAGFRILKCLTSLHKHDTRSTTVLIASLLILAICHGCVTPATSLNPVYFPAPPASPHVVHLKSFNHLHDIIAPNLSWVDKFRGGLASPFVSTPSGIAFHNQHLYICDTAQHCVHQWNLFTGQTYKFGESGNVTLQTPVAVAVDHNNFVYVADTGRKEVVVFNPSGDAIHRLKPKPDESMKPTALTVQGELVYVTDIITHRIFVFNSVTGLVETSFGGPGNDVGKLYFPMGITSTLDNHLLVADSMNGRIQRFDNKLKPINVIGNPGDRYGDMGRPRHLVAGPDGIIFVADTAFAHVHMFNHDGQLLMLLGGPGNEPGDTPMPISLAIASTLPPTIRALVPATFDPHYFLFVSNTLGDQRLSLYAVGTIK